MEFLWILLGLVLGFFAALFYFRRNAVKEMEKQVNREAAVPSVETIKMIASAFGAKPSEQKANKIRAELQKQNR
jgi:uncharacterized protein YneF (UPF0154 family)